MSVRSGSAWRMAGILAAAGLAPLLTSCGTLVRRNPYPAGSSMPQWYHASDPAPDAQHTYFTGYAEAAPSFSRARSMAESEARRNAAAFLNTEVVNRFESFREQQGTDWANVLDDRGFLAQLGLRKTAEEPPSSDLADRVSERLREIVAESVVLARVQEVYTEEVTVQSGWWGQRHVRYDGGVLLALPTSSVADFQELQKERLATRAAVGATVAKAERLWAAGEKEEAVDLLRKAHREQPLDHEVSVRLGQYLEDTGRAGEALDVYAAVANTPDADGEWAALAKGRTKALRDARLERILKMVGDSALRGRDLTDVMNWASDGQLGRARQMARARFEADAGSGLMLWAWHLTSALDRDETQALAARYDYDESAEKMGTVLAGWTSPKDAEAAILATLMFVQQDLAAETALSCLEEIRAKIGQPAVFSETVQEAASEALGSRRDRKSQELLDWLHGK